MLMKTSWMPRVAAAFLLTTLAQAVEPADTDNDGISNAWETAMGLSPSDPSDANTDGDQDGLTALMEYALGGSTTASDTALMPRLVLVTSGTETRAEFSFYRRHDHPGLVVMPELATTLGAGAEWSANDMELKAAPVRIGGGLESVTYRSAPVTVADRRFMRARLSVARKLLSSGLGSVGQITTPSVGVGGSTTLGTGAFEQGKDGNGARMSTSGDVIQFPVSGGAGTNLSLLRGEVEFWFKPSVDADDDTTTRVLFALGNYANAPNLVLAESNRLTLTLTTATRSESVASDLNAPLWRAGEWVHLRAAWDSASSADSLQLFVNGVRIGGGASGGWSLEGANAPAQFFLGSANAVGAFPAGGVFDSVCVRDHRQAWEQTNHPPVIGLLNAHWLLEGQTLSFTTSASDPDNHGLTFSLDPGAPPGAFLNPTTGAFSYTPTTGAAPAFYDFRIRVTDDGTPNMSASSRITIGVVETHPPVLSNLTPFTQNTTPTGAPQATFDWQDPDGDIVTVRVTRTNVLGTVQEDAPAIGLGISGSSGQATLLPKPADLPYGTTTFTVQLVDSQGNTSAPGQTFQVTVLGAAATGQAPTLLQFQPVLYSRVHRPHGNLDVTYSDLTLMVFDDDADAERVRLTITMPGNTAKTFEQPLATLGADMSATSVTVSLRPFKFENTSPLGVYQFQVVVVDENGHVGNSMSTSVELIAEGFAAQFAPYITSITPPAGNWGDEITIQGSIPDGFETVAVELGGQSCVLTAANLGSLSFIVPHGAFSGPIILRTNMGAMSVSDTVFQVNPKVDIFPLSRPLTSDGTPIENEVVQVVEGGEIGFDHWTTLPAHQGGDVTWHVNDVPGGNLLVGTISPEGVYHAPDTVNAPVSVVVKARLVANPAVFDTHELRIVPKVQPPGGGLVRAATGGSIRAFDGRSSVVIPPGALASDATITMSTLTNMQLPAARPGMRVLAGVTLGPSGLVFASPVTLTLPLARAQTPGGTIPVLFYNTTTSQYVDEGIMGTVSDDGQHVVCQCTHFSSYVIDEPLAAANPPAATPTVTSPSPPAAPIPGGAFEGMTQPVLFTGTNLASDLQIQVLDELGQPSNALSTGPLFANPAGTQAGCTIFVNPDPNLDEGEGALYTLRLLRPGFGHADAIFAVAGLDELILGPSSMINLSNEPPRRFSTIQIPSGAVLRVTAGSLNYTATGPIIVDGRIDASGRDGYDGDERNQGAAGLQGGRGGMGQDKPPRKPFPEADFYSVDQGTSENRGADGNDVYDSAHDPAGYGGASGVSVKLDITSLVGSVAAAITTGGTSLISAADQIISAVNAIGDIGDGAAIGRRGLGATRFAPPSGQDTTGGGGGGGAGQFEVDVSVLGNGVDFTVDGGGGGAGGDGGRNVSLRTDSSITVNGLITTRGGDGGDGSTTSSFKVDLTVLFISLPTLDFGSGGCPSFPGGGGGGGRGGRLNLIGNQGVFTGFNSIECRGGNGGLTGFVEIDPANETMEFGTHRNSLSQGPALGLEVSGPIFDPTHFHTKTTDRRILRMEGLRKYYNSSPGGGVALEDPMTLYLSYQPFPVPEPINVDDMPEVPLNPASDRYEGFILLHEGWNTLTTNLERPVAILVISNDADTDGLSDRDEQDIGTLINDADSDDDGLTDGDEIVRGSDPLNPDSDGDLLADGQEISAFSTNPAKWDTDGDGFSDSAEIVLGSIATHPNSKPQRLPVNSLLTCVAAQDGVRLGVFSSDRMLLGVLGRPGGLSPFSFGLACNAYGDVFILNGSALSLYDPVNDTSTSVGTLTGGLVGGSLAFNPADGMLYTQQVLSGQATGQLLRIHPGTGATVMVGAALAQPLKSLAFTWDGRLFACQNAASGGDLLIEIDESTGAVLSTIGTTGHIPLSGLVFSRDQVLYAAQPAAGGSLLRLDAGTAAATAVTTALRPFTDLTITPRPPPGFTEIATYMPPGVGPVHAVKVANLNGDAYPDFVYLQDDYFSQHSRLVFTLGSVTEEFTEPGGTVLAWDTVNGSGSAIQLAVGDLNADGITDVVAPSTNEAGKTALMLSQTTSGNYTGHVRSDLLHATSSFWAGITSMNPLTDNHPDIVISTATQLIIKLNNGTASAWTDVIIPFNGPLFMDIGDLNHDGFPEIVTAGFIVPNNGNGTFGSVQTFATGADNVSDIKVADINGDTHADVFYGSIQDGTNQTGNALRVHLGNGTLNGLAAPVAHPAEFVTSSWDRVVSHDFDNDGIRDVLGGNFETGIYAFFHPATASERTVNLSNTGDDVDLDGSTAFDIGHLLGDPGVEVVVANQYSDMIHFYRTSHPFKE